MDANTKDVLIVAIGLIGTVLGVMLGGILKTREMLTIERASTYADFLVKLEEVEALIEGIGSAAPPEAFGPEDLESLRQYRFAIAGQAARVLISDPKLGAEATKAATHVRRLLRIAQGKDQPSLRGRDWAWSGEVQGLRTAMSTFRLYAREGRGLLKRGTTDEAKRAARGGS